MKKLIINNKEEDSQTVVLSEQDAQEELIKMGFPTFIKEYDIDDQFIKDNVALINPSDVWLAIIEGLPITQDLLEFFLDKKVIKKECISDLSMSIYSKLGDGFIDKYKEYINWTKMVTYLASIEKLDIENYYDIIEEKGLWNIISSTELPIDFIREHKGKLKWNVLLATNHFTEEELEEFSDHIPNNTYTGNQTVGSFDTELFKEELKNKGINIYMGDYTDEKTEQLTPDEISKIKNMLKVLK